MSGLRRYRLYTAERSSLGNTGKGRTDLTRTSFMASIVIFPDLCFGCQGRQDDYIWDNASVWNDSPWARWNSIDAACSIASVFPK